MIATSTAKNRVSAFHLTTKGILAEIRLQTASDTSASPELILVCFNDLALQLEGLFWEQLEVSDVV